MLFKQANLEPTTETSTQAPSKSSTPSIVINSERSLKDQWMWRVREGVDILAISYESVDVIV